MRQSGKAREEGAPRWALAQPCAHACTCVCVCVCVWCGWSPQEVPAHVREAAGKAHEALELRQGYEDAVAPGKEADAGEAAAGAVMLAAGPGDAMRVAAR